MRTCFEKWHRVTRKWPIGQSKSRDTTCLFHDRNTCLVINIAIVMLRKFCCGVYFHLSVYRG